MDSPTPPTTPPENNAVRTVAVIDIGTAAIRMSLADILADGSVVPLEKMSQSVFLGRDTFARGKIRGSTIESCVRTLKSFQQIMREYRVAEHDVHAVASSSVQEASNREAFVDRIAMATGIRVEIIDDADATRLTYLSVLPYLRGRAGKEGITLVMEIGGGRTEFLALQGEKVLASRAIRLGAMRLANMLEEQHASLVSVPDMLREEVSHAVQQFKDLVPGTANSLIVLGGDARFVARRLDPAWDGSRHKEVPLKVWKKTAAELLAMTSEQRVRKYKLTFSEADTVGPAVFAYSQLAESFGVQALQVSGFTMRDGLLAEVAQGNVWSPKYVRQIMDAVKALGEKFHLEVHHAREVSGLATRIFDALQGEHHLSQRHRVLLEVSAYLHEIGTFISPNSHHKHSMYVILNANIFGLSRRDTRIVANVARYHRRSPPKATHTVYQALSRRDRIVVQQLAAVLRVADALARSRGRHIRDIECSRHEDTFTIRVPGVDNLHLESMALQTKGQMFEDVYGMNVILLKG